MDPKTRILAFLQSHTTMTLSTVTPEGKPESAIVEYVALDTLELVFDTFATYRKYENLRHHSSVACVVVEGDRTVQYEGEAVELFGAKLAAYKEPFFAKIPRARKFESRPETRYFTIIPRWIRYSDLGKDPWEVFEVTMES